MSPLLLVRAGLATGRTHRLLWLVAAGLAASPGLAGELVYAPAVFANEVVNPRGDTDFTLPFGTLDYRVGSPVAPQRLTLRFELGRMRLRTPLGPERLTFRSGSPETAATTVRVEPSAGGALGDDFVAFSVTTDGPMALDDRLALDLDGVVVRVAAADLPLAQGTFLSVTGSLSNAINELDVGGRRSAWVLGLMPCISAALTPGSRALAATPQATFVGLPRSLDASAHIALDLGECLRLDGRAVRGIDDLGRLLLTIRGERAAIQSIELPGLGAFGWDGAAYQLDLVGGAIDYDGPVRILVDGQTDIGERTLTLEARFVGRAAGNERRLLGPVDLTRWEPIDRKQIVDVVPVPPGPDCAAGGVRIDEGRDWDYDGQLDEDEIERTQWVCNGDPGAAGEDGYSVIQEVEDEPATATCPEGGWRVLSGLDLDRDGRLDANEIDNEVLLCHGRDGEDGLVGPEGPMGRTGPPGATGATGARGEAGLPGESATSESGGCEQVPGGGEGLLLLGLIALGRRRRAR
ncbi:MAG: collagen-like protein [bacterium]